ncbi:D-arabinono-14-lactone oxidase [Wenyingzhuangia fucanilytica]|uniref:D-arabinono-14-lactone oxidase n=1 Tax=Wenyingzhuangia fucanilytica TaxID=1790137 RepID=A0A1B1Y7Q8_9FLAO|nr:D-arabinono-1,4-lactone oxidase [Wenyingzhuangia fucanilytica]ANW96787.1 D-arabinono-14-lactone oxidase [Wenyingzhuangia fucanilytica]
MSKSTKKAQTNKEWVSWNKNIKHSYENLIKVNNEDELVNAIANNSSVRVFGNRFSSSDIHAGTSTLVDVSNYDKIVNINKETKEITVQAGISLEKVINTVQACGWCIPCLPDINKITIGGALATATHGTNGFILSKYVSKFRMVMADGTIREFTNQDPEIDAIRVSIGLLGVFSEITFTCEENYRLHIKEAPMKDADWTAKLDGFLNTYDFVRILWLPHTNHGYVILGNKVDQDFKFKSKSAPKYYKKRRKISQKLYKYTHKYPRFTAIANKILYFLFFTAKQEHAGSLYDATVTKKRGATMELAEWTVSYSKFQDLFKELKAMLEDKTNKAYVHVPMDIRFLKKDNAWLSYAADEDVVTVGCVCRNSPKANDYVAFEKVEELFLKYKGKPHWAKRFSATYVDFEKLYTKWNDFVVLRSKLDPTNKFLNGYLTKLFVK